MADKPKNTELTDEYAESIVIASLITNPKWLEKVDLDIKDFTLKEYQNIFRSIITLQQEDEAIDEDSVTKKVGQDNVWAISKAMSSLITDEDCPHYSFIVKDLSRKRQIVEVINNAMGSIYSPENTSEQIADAIRLTIEEIKYPSDTSRFVSFPRVEIYNSDPPAYVITVKPINKDAFSIICTSPELDQPKAMKRKIREKGKMNPILPKKYDALIHHLVKMAKVVQTSKDTSEDEILCSHIREWLKSVPEARTIEDLDFGYYSKDGYNWFKSNTLLKYIKKEKIVIRGLFPQTLEPKLKNKSIKHKQHRVGGKPVWLFGLPHKFFEIEEEGPIEDDQLTMESLKKSDMDWLENE